MDKKETAQYTHQRVLDFTFTCDNKASFLLAFVGVVFSFVVTSNHITTIIIRVTDSLWQYWVGDDEMVIDWSLAAVGVSFFVFFVLFSMAIYYLLAALTANIDPDGQNSLVFFGTIAEKNETAEDYRAEVQNKLNGNSIENDLLRQVYLCSQICLKKYKNYGIAVCLVKWGVGALLVFMALSFFCYGG